MEILIFSISIISLCINYAGVTLDVRFRLYHYAQNFAGIMNPTLTYKIVVLLKKPSYGFLNVLVAVAVIVAKTPF